MTCLTKAAAAAWGYDALPEWRRHIELARKSYARQATPQDREFMRAEVAGLLEFARVRIAGAAGDTARRWNEPTR